MYRFRYRFRQYIRGLITEYKERGGIEVTDLYGVGVCSGCRGVFHVSGWPGRHSEKDQLQTIAVKGQQMIGGRIETCNFELPGEFCNRCRDEYHKGNVPPPVVTSWEGRAKPVNEGDINE